MNEVVETPVTTETPRGADAFTAAREAVGKADALVPEVSTSDDTPTETPAEDTETTADQPQETVSDPDTLLTPEELAALPPKERAKAEKWQAKLTQKAQALSAKEKEFSEWEPLIQGFKTNSKETLAQVAKQLGMTVAELKAQDTPSEDLPDELAFLKPVFEQRERALVEKLRAENAPIKQAYEQVIAETSAAETESTLKSMSAEFPGWEKHEPKMLEIAREIQPAAGTSEAKYLRTLYKLATADLTEAERTKKVVARINQSAKVSEERTSGIANERVAHAMPPPEKRSMRDAFEAAKRGEVWEK